MRLVTTPSEHRMKTRSVELFLAVVMAMQGLIYLIPGDTFDLPHYAYLREWVAFFPGTEERFGALLLFVGLLRSNAVLLNGTYSKTAWLTPPARLIGCFVGSTYWMTLAISFATADVPGTPAALSWTFAGVCFEVFSSLRATVDAHAYNSFGVRKRKSAGTSS